MVANRDWNVRATTYLRCRMGDEVGFVDHARARGALARVQDNAAAAAAGKQHEHGGRGDKQRGDGELLQHDLCCDTTTQVRIQPCMTHIYLHF